MLPCPACSSGDRWLIADLRQQDCREPIRGRLTAWWRPGRRGVPSHRRRFRLRINAGSLWSMLRRRLPNRSEEHTSELQSLMRISYAVFCLKKKKNDTKYLTHIQNCIHSSRFTEKL